MTNVESLARHAIRVFVVYNKTRDEDASNRYLSTEKIQNK